MNNSSTHDQNKPDAGLSQNTHSDNDLSHIKQAGFFTAMMSLGYIFWIVGGMEIIERIAYYGVKTSAALYAKAPASENGLGISPAQYGTILFIWAITQTFVPIVTGGISDRIGYKETIAISTVIKILGYLTMAFFPSFWGFTVGAMLLALGTGIFKPGIQGTMVKSINKNNSTMAWGIFYQLVNLGGYFGPIIAIWVRQLQCDAASLKLVEEGVIKVCQPMQWELVFFVCAGVIALNFLMLFLYKEPGKEERLAHRAAIKNSGIKSESLWTESLREIRKPVVFWYMIVFSGFWFLYNTLFDVLPYHLDDWINTSTIVTDIFGPGGATNEFWIKILGMDKSGTRIMPDAMIGLNFLLIMTTCFIVAGLTAKYQIVSSMFAGAVLCCVAIFLVGFTPAAWAILFGILIFTIGEMLISPKKGELMGNIAPKGKHAMYLGFVMLPQGIGWSIEAKLGPWLYGEYASKEKFALELLADRGMPADQIAAIPQNDGFNALIKYTGESPQALTDLLYSMHNISILWYIFTAIGTVSAVGIFFYAKWMIGLQKQ